MAKAAGGKLGRLIELSTEQPDYSEASLVLVRGTVESAAQSGTTIIPASAQLRVSVHARWEFVSGS